MVDLAPKWAKEAAEEGVRIARESFEEMKRHNQIVEQLLKEIRDRIPWITTPTITTQNPSSQWYYTNVPRTYGID